MRIPPRASAQPDRSLRAALARHQQPSPLRSLAQLATSLLPFAGLCLAMYLALDVSYWLTLALAVPCAGFVVRIFIIQHDCGHGAFFRARWLNDMVGRGCGLLTLTPYRNWRRQHAGHHANWNNLDRRESGADIYSLCLTTEEYRALSPGQRLFYRTLRHPLIASVLLPPLVFLVLYRVPFDTPADWRLERLSVHGTNLAIAAAVLGFGVWIGFAAVAKIYVPIMCFAAIAGVWLFTVQHRFEDGRWFRNTEWSANGASIHGTSYLRLPRVLQWFSGNIGFHHVHHLNSRIPNYRLAACHASSVALQQAPMLSLWQAMTAPLYCLWDESKEKMVRFADVVLVNRPNQV